MATPEHLVILKQGVKVWNEWRQKNPLIHPNLTKADLTYTDLRGADLRDADLGGATLWGADLGEAKFWGADLGKAGLWRANLGWADLRDSVLREADLREADLGGADLRGADLRGANLGGADLGRADLGGANLLGATLFETVIGAVNLSTVVGLNSCVHLGPSILDHRTLERSGPLPVKFLRGCGLPDTLIAYISSLLNKEQPIQFYTCFISYSAKDQAFAERLHTDLQDKGVRCWFAPKDLEIGAKIRPRIDESIRAYDKLLLTLSKHSVASQWVEQEVETALETERKAKAQGQERTVLFPIRLDNAIMNVEGGWQSLIRNTRNIGDFCKWKDHDRYQTAFARLLDGLKTDSKPPARNVP